MAGSTRAPLLIERLRRHAHDLVNGGTPASELRDDLQDAAARLEQATALITIATGAWHLLESLHAVRDGVPDASIRRISDALRTAITHAEGADGQP